MEVRQEQIRVERRNAKYFPVLQLKNDRGGEFFSDITFDQTVRIKTKTIMNDDGDFIEVVD